MGSLDVEEAVLRVEGDADFLWLVRAQVEVAVEPAVALSIVADWVGQRVVLEHRGRARWLEVELRREVQALS